MPVILRNVPAGYDWGWYSREDPRMHLQVVDHEHRKLGYHVWLEARGQRVFEPEGDIPAKLLRKLQPEVEFARPTIEAKWIDMMIRKGWLTHTVRESLITLVAYPNTPNRLVRTIDLNDHLAPEFVRRVRPENVRLNAEYAVLELWADRPEPDRDWIQLSPILWQG